eukprot:GHVR01107307.1.p1 GENE.GHVR01107307.1~~GHVR01107307.1.p1  ORF type:complete len:153 (-),score=19.35 GHVR01107307.1:33-491(-)
MNLFFNKWLPAAGRAINCKCHIGTNNKCHIVGGRRFFSSKPQRVVEFREFDNSKTWRCTFKPGQTLLDVALENDVPIEGACGGVICCSTCHVILQPDVYKRHSTPVSDEIDVLDMCPHLQNTSRLGCQVTLTEADNGAVLTLPSECVNLMLR